MKKKAFTVCGCNKASKEFCEQCPQYLKLNPDVVYVISQWDWDVAYGPKNIRREN